MKTNTKRGNKMIAMFVAIVVAFTFTPFMAANASASTKAPSIPKLTSASTTYTSDTKVKMTLKWTKASRAKKYQIATRSASKSWKYSKKVKKTSENKRTYTKKNLYKVKSYGKYYKVYKYVYTYKVIKTTTARSYVVSGATNKTYRFVIRAYNGKYSGWSNYKSLYKKTIVNNNTNASINKTFNITLYTNGTESQKSFDTGIKELTKPSDSWDCTVTNIEGRNSMSEYYFTVKNGVVGLGQYVGMTHATYTFTNGSNKVVLNITATQLQNFQTTADIVALIKNDTNLSSATTQYEKAEIVSKWLSKNYMKVDDIGQYGQCAQFEKVTRNVLKSIGITQIAECGFYDSVNDLGHTLSIVKLDGTVYTIDSFKTSQAIRTVDMATYVPNATTTKSNVYCPSRSVTIQWNKADLQL